MADKTGQTHHKQGAAMRDIEHSLPMQLLRAREAAMARFRPMLRGHGLTEQQWRVIRVLAAAQSIDATELARRSFLLAPSLTRILQFLEARNLVQREADSRDQRRSVLKLTPAGWEVFGAVAPDSERLYANIEREFGQGKLQKLYDLLADFTGAIASDSRPTE
ncbi:MAG: homoprotocatechuate degradation operon regulator HpaR [Gammaproteobacteria bacterium]|nr:homoprotocatechuate degradation operon regulator HpaR [Gammaproteobacteria bacterium]MDH4253585.1 homoprotocatechuate degradation operon regulator HpaR [Gammaproteobacteria bacterium]MDH5310170.1 homoprotocatechuate degradation operon regulator HpaR [Gammaproteobacteria bacterium]